MSHDFPYTAKRRVEALVKTLRSMADRDPEQEVQGIALPVLDAIVEEAKGLLAADPVVQAVAGIISPETLELGEPIRATNALLVAEHLDAAIGPYQTLIA